MSFPDLPRIDRCGQTHTCNHAHTYTNTHSIQHTHTKTHSYTHTGIALYTHTQCYTCKLLHKHCESLFLITLLFNASVERNADETKVDKPIAEVIEMVNPDILLNQRHQNVNGSDKYTVSWTHCKQFLNECTAIQERRQNSVCTYIG